MLLSGAIDLFVARAAWVRRHAPGALFLMMMELTAAEWSFAIIFEMAATHVPGKMFWSQVSYIGIAFTSYFFFLFAASYSQNSRFLKRRIYLALAVIPLITVIMAATNDVHHFLWTEITIQPHNNIAIYSHGFYFAVGVGYSYVLVFAGILLLAAAIYRFPSNFLFQMIIMILGGLTPLAGSIMYVFNLNPMPGMDWTPLAFMVSGLFLALGIFRFQMLDLTPVARERIVDTMGDGVIVMDAHCRIVDVNSAMEVLLSRRGGELIGRLFSNVLPLWHEALECCREPAAYRREVKLLENGGAHYYDVRLMPMHDRRKKLAGQFLIVRDIQKEKELEEEKNNLIKELSAALQRVKTLNGLLPICSSCKKIRDDKGYWKNVEHYIEEHSGAEFTHGICPDCAKKLKEKSADSRMSRNMEDGGEKK
jgi:PAS domain S-box-containing protein